MVAGGILSRRPGTLSGDGKLLLCPCGSVVIIYSAVTGDRINVLVGHSEEVTGVILDPENHDQAYSCSLDGSVRLWDYRAGEELRRLVVGQRIKYMVFQKEIGVAYFAVELQEGGGRVMVYNMRTGKFSGNALKTRSASPLVLSTTGSLAATVDRHSLLVWRTGTEIYQPLNLHHTRPYTCLAISEDDSMIAAGDISGRILIWQSFEHSVPSALRDSKHTKMYPAVHPPLTTLHWHAHPVGALTFSPDGTFLLSGGVEGVLVIWQVDGYGRDFLPRLGGPIVGLGPSPADPAKYVVRHADNVVHIVNTATMKVESSVIGLQPPPAGLVPQPAGPSGGAAAFLATGVGASGGGGGIVLVTPTEQGLLQFYDVLRDRHMQRLQVVTRGYVSLTEPQRAAESLLPPFVSLLAFSADGSVLVTVDVRPDAGLYGSMEACLKFWDLTSTGPVHQSTSGLKPKSPYTLNTRVDEVHIDSVTSLVYHPHRHLVVTTGGTKSDSVFKMWVQEQWRLEAGLGGRQGHGWRCRSIGSYKGLTLAAAAFSADGSVMALAAGARVTLWDSESSALTAVLPAATAAVAGPATAALTHLTFVPGTPFLAAASPSCLVVYNVLTAAVHWYLPMRAMSISADAAYGLLAVAIPVLPSASAAPQLPAGAVATADTPPPSQVGPMVASAEAAVPASSMGGKGAAAGRGSAATPTPATGGKGAARHAPARKPSPAPSSCQVVVFDPRDATPRYHCHVPGAARVHISHLKVAPAAAGGPEGSSPLLILHDSRQYTLAALPGCEALPGESPPSLPLSRDQALSTFETVFGRSVASTGPTSMDPSAPSRDIPAAGGAAPGAVHVGGRPRWAELFDAPSHVLPPATALATSFLTLLTTTDP